LLEDFPIEVAFPFEEWVLAQRKRLQRLVIQASYQLASLYEQQGDCTASIAVMGRLLTIEPWQETAHQKLMRLLARNGQIEAALAQYEQCCKILAEELGVEPQPETQTLYQRLKASRNTRADHLPTYPTRFVGRQTELCQLLDNLDRPNCRLMTIIGPGGIGKTRLAINVAKQLAGHFADGVHFVGLAGVQMPESTVPTIAETIGCHLSGNGADQTQLLTYLRHKQMLLVIDNFEHLVSSPSCTNLVSQIIRDAPDIKILVTSQQRLQLQAEWLFPLSGLAYPTDDNDEADTSSEALDLFYQCARRVLPNFEQTADWPSLVRICRLLNGMPLAIELAAAWVQFIPCEDIVSDLTRSLDLLATTLQDVPERHKSMQTVFDYAWERLSSQEQTIFMQLSVFAGKFDREAAQQVAGASINKLASLVNKSLLRVEASGQYSMLEPIKKYAHCRLIEQADRPCLDVQERHGQYFLTLLASQKSQLQGGGQTESLAQISIVFKDIQVAWHWAIDCQHFEDLVQACNSLLLFCEMQNRFQEGDALFNRAITVLESLSSKQMPSQQYILGWLYACRGQLLHNQGDYPKARKALEVSLMICPADEFPDLGAFALHSLSRVVNGQGEYHQARTMALDSVTYARLQGLKWDEGWALNSLSLGDYNLGDYDEAQQASQQSLDLHQQIGNQHGEAACLNLLGLIICGKYEWQNDKYEQARDFFEQNLAIRQSLHDHAGAASALHNLGYIHFKLRQFDQAQTRFEASLKISRMAGCQRMVTATTMWLGVLAMEQYDFVTAQEILMEALKIAYVHGALTRTTDILARLGDLWWRQDQIKPAMRTLTLVTQHPATDDRVREEAQMILAAIEAQFPQATRASFQTGEAVSNLDELVGETMSLMILESGDRLIEAEEHLNVTLSHGI
ncbi:MAG: tetratricopeptide repeat protein, partial [Chloroflexota bacterium]